MHVPLTEVQATKQARYRLCHGTSSINGSPSGAVVMSGEPMTSRASAAPVQSTTSLILHVKKSLPV